MPLKYDFRPRFASAVDASLESVPPAEGIAADQEHLHSLGTAGSAPQPAQPFPLQRAINQITCSLMPACKFQVKEVMGEKKKTLRPAPPWVQIRMPLLAYTSCSAGPEVLCSLYPGAHIARMRGWPDVLAMVYPLPSQNDRVPAATPCPRSSLAPLARGSSEGALGTSGMAPAQKCCPCSRTQQ